AELRKAKEEVAEKERKCVRLSQLQSVVDSEVQELTEKLFQEAYKMVNTAEEKREHAEKLLAEARMKVDMLQAEVQALKTIVKSPKRSIAQRFLNTPSRRDASSVSPARRSPSTSPSSPDLSSVAGSKPTNVCEIDPIYYREFADWRENALGMDDRSAFLARIITEDVLPCLTFENAELSTVIFDAIKQNALEMEYCNEEKPTPRQCALSKVDRLCPYRVRISSEGGWHYISLLARNRITAVCDFFTYVRYLHQGIVKSNLNQSYWEVVNLRKNMMLAKLGLQFVLKVDGQSTCSSPDAY
ncbi:Protein F54C9.11, partial [Aphelenchoides avenae]